MPEGKGKRQRVGFALSGDNKLVEQVSAALAEVLHRLSPGQKLTLTHDVGRWEQEGGWYLSKDPDGDWSQSGGWVLDIEGKLTHGGGRPSEMVVRDVWAALDRVKPDPNWDQSWGPLPKPKPGPGPDPIRKAGK